VWSPGSMNRNKKTPSKLQSQFESVHMECKNATSLTSSSYSLTGNFQNLKWWNQDPENVTTLNNKLNMVTLSFEPRPRSLIRIHAVRDQFLYLL
jgi:hypothetical protein